MIGITPTNVPQPISGR